MKFTGGGAIVEMLKRYEVEFMFGLPGDQTHIYDAILRNSSIRHILVRHEQAAAHMADAYARATGKVGVCDATVGPGATNLISGIAEAYASCIPVIAIVSDIRTDWRGRGSLQEVDQVGIFKPITKAAFSLDLTSRVPEIVRRAFQIATSGKPGPVLLNCPLDMLKGEHDFEERDFDVDARFGRYPALRQLPPGEEIEQAVELMLRAEKPLIVCGGGVHSSSATAEVQRLAGTLDVPVTTTFMGKGSLPEDHPLCLGPFGLLGRPDTNEYVLGCDFVLALGTRFTNVDTAGWRVPQPGTAIVQVDIAAEDIGRNYAVALALAGDIKLVVQAMLAHVQARKAGGNPKRRAAIEALVNGWRSKRGIEKPQAKDLESAPVHPLQVIRALRTVMRPEDLIICDSGFNQIWGGQYFEVRAAGRTYMGPRGFGVMGFSFPAAIGAYLANPKRRTVALCGDGGFSMVLQELETAKRLNVPVIVCVMNNSNLEYVKHNQRMMYESRFISSDYTDVNFADIANAFGCVGIRVERSGDLEEALRRAFECGRPAVVDVHTVESAEPDRISLQKLSGKSLYPTS